MNLLDRAKSIPKGVETIFEWLSESGIPVNPVEAQQRANVCLKCPMNVVGGVLTGAVANAVRRHLEVKNKLGMRVQGEKSLGECQMCGCQLRLKIWTPQEIVFRHTTIAEREKAPAYCWQTKEPQP